MDKEFFIKNKKKIIIVVAVIAVSLIGFSLLNSTYSLFYHEDISKNTEGYTTGTLSITASSKGNTVSLSDALPVEDSVGSTSTPYTFTVTNTGNLNYKFNIKLLSTGSSSTTIGSQYIKLKVDDGSIATLSSLSNGIIKKDVTLAAGESIDISVRVWLSISTPNSQIGKTFNSKIVIDGQAVYTEAENVSNAADETLDRLNKLNNTIAISSGTPNFTKTSIDDKTNGIYSANDDLGTSYYFRGNVTNNYVKFANKYWRIIRINGDGTIRMIYAGTSAHANGYDDSSTNDMSVASYGFNSSYNDNTYVGYMYGTAGATSYANTHSNTTNSTIKTKLDSWYDTNIVNTGNEKYIADAIYCNDRSVSSGTGIGTTNTNYAAKTRINNGTPTLKCANNSDKFTKSTTIGNGKLTEMIGLITSDEAMYAGGKSGTANQEYYLYSGTWYWTMAPFSYVSGIARVDSVGRSGTLSNYNVSDSYVVRPVVSLKSDAISGGSGTAASPFLVG